MFITEHYFAKDLPGVFPLPHIHVLSSWLTMLLYCIHFLCLRYLSLLTPLDSELFGVRTVSLLFKALGT